MKSILELFGMHILSSIVRITLSKKERSKLQISTYQNSDKNDELIVSLNIDK